MTLEEAKELRNKYRYLVGEPYHLPNNPNKILALIIAPTDTERFTTITIISDLALHPENNEKYLKDIDALDTDLDVFVVWEDGNRRYPILIKDYIAQTVI